MSEDQKFKIWAVKSMLTVDLKAVIYLFDVELYYIIKPGIEHSYNITIQS